MIFFSFLFRLAALDCIGSCALAPSQKFHFATWEAKMTKGRVVGGDGGGADGVGAGSRGQNQMHNCGYEYNSGFLNPSCGGIRFI